MLSLVLAYAAPVDAIAGALAHHAGGRRASASTVTRTSAIISSGVSTRTSGTRNSGTSGHGLGMKSSEGAVGSASGGGSGSGAGSPASKSLSGAAEIESARMLRLMETNTPSADAKSAAALDFLGAGSLQLGHIADKLSTITSTLGGRAVPVLLPPRRPYGADVPAPVPPGGQEGGAAATVVLGPGDNRTPAQVQAAIATGRNNVRGSQGAETSDAEEQAAKIGFLAAQKKAMEDCASGGGGGGANGAKGGGDGGGDGDSGCPGPLAPAVRVVDTVEGKICVLPSL